MGDRAPMEAARDPMGSRIPMGTIRDPMEVDPMGADQDPMGVTRDPMGADPCAPYTRTPGSPSCRGFGIRPGSGVTSPSVAVPMRDPLTAPGSGPGPTDRDPEMDRGRNRAVGAVTNRGRGCHPPHGPNKAHIECHRPRPCPRGHTWPQMCPHVAPNVSPWPHVSQWGPMWPHVAPDASP